MNTEKITLNAMEDSKVNVKLKLAALWTSLMFLIIYIDYFHLYMPGMTTIILTRRFTLAGKATERKIMNAGMETEASPATINPCVISNTKTFSFIRSSTAVNIPFMLFNLAGVAWIHMVFGALVEVILLCLVISYAWKWPRIEK